MKKASLYCRPWIILLGIFIFSQGCQMRDGQKQQPQQPRMDYKPGNTDPRTFFFGQVKSGKVLKHFFVLRNVSKNTLAIKDVSTSCGCTASKADKKSLAPGESTTIEVKFDTKKYSGHVKQFVYVQTDDPYNPILKFTIEADVVK